MTKHEIAKLSCRIVALCIVALALPYVWQLPLLVVSLIVAVVRGDMDWYEVLGMLGFGGTVAVQVGFALLLWFKAAMVSRWMVGDGPQDDPADADAVVGWPAMCEVQAVAFAVLGLWILTRVAPKLMHFGLLIIWKTEADRFANRPFFSGEDAGQLASIILEIVLGLCLLFGGRRLAMWLFSLRKVGLKDKQRSDS
ncbi:MAG: hypothetical protein KAS72_12660 [Phycisphaerales bacterium]|nr:hypothetical protein [Phycisphaerales bacterium]